MAITEAGPAAWVEPATTPWTETTRLLCAAAYTEPTFAQEVVEQVVEEDHRAVVMPPGVDPGPVIRHCLAAFGEKTLRDRALAAILGLAGLYLLVAGNVIMLAGAAAWGAILYLAGRVAGARARRVLAVYFAVVLVLLLVAVGGVLVGLLVFLTAWATVAYDLWRAIYQIVTKRLRPNTFDPAAAPAAGSPELAHRTDEIAERQAGNLTVYSGFLPFVGAGFDLGGWSFVVDLRKGGEEAGDRLEPQPVAPLDLYTGVERALRDLGMEHLTIEDRAYVNGTDIRDDRDLLPTPAGRPVSGVPDDELRRLMVAPTHRARHYTCIRVTDWRGELVLSLYLRFGISNDRLFCELSGFLLTPLKPELHRSDGIAPDPEVKDVLLLALRSLARTPGLWVRSPSALLRPLQIESRRAKQLRRVKRDAFFDYGASETVLDRVRSTDYARYFQKLDKEMYAKVLERTILDAIVEVLDAHDVDTGELVERRTTIINNGLMVRGGRLEAKNLAVGPGAKVVDRLTGGTPPAAGPGSTGGKA